MRPAALLLFALGYVGLIAWLLIAVRNYQRVHHTGEDNSKGLGLDHSGEDSRDARL